MAENIILNSIVEGIVGELGSFFLSEIGLLWGAKKDLRKLEGRMSAIKAVLLDAEEKQAHSNLVRDWLQKLQGVVYDADDLVDDFHTEALRRGVMPGNKLTKKVCIFFSTSNQLAFRLKMGHKIKEIREALDEIPNENTFQLVERVEETRSVSGKARETHSYVREEDVIGRDNERMEILKLLLHDDATKETVSTITMIGIGGLGKTTLAQYVFNDAMVQKHFDLRLWVCVSDEFDLRLIVGKIIKSATNKSVDQSLELDQLQKNLRGEIEGKKYFLVLDDVWNEDLTKWHDLKSLLMGGAIGSRVLVTTRSDKVARITHTVGDQPFKLNGLEKDKSWSLFSKMAFSQVQDLNNPEFVDLGKAILEKCKGVPLAIKTIGSILYFKNPKTEWSFFKDNELAKVTQEEDDILPTLKLSYNHLPSYLKHCFAYCRLFPKDHVFDVQMLITLWMAQGFIKADQNQSLEDIGYGYFLDLLWRSFFQEAKEDNLGNIVGCKMHDLMHDLAISVAGNGSVLINKDSTNFGENLVHVSFDFSLDTTAFLKSVSPLLKHHYKLRTLFCFSNQDWKNDLALTNCMEGCLKFKLLRALDLNTFSFMKKLPNSFGEYKHLRYLNLSKFREIEKLPDSITKLQNLQTLNLSECDRLSSLPRDMHKMVSLRHLVLDGCWGLTHMPRRLGELTCLHTLSRFVLPARHHVKHSSIGGVGELRNLNSLRGKLAIRNLGPDIVESSETANLQEKQHLQKLELYYLEFEEDDHTVVEKKYEKSLELLQPHPNLKVLEVKGYMGVRFASWVKALINLVELLIWDCPNLTSLPEAIGNLSSLQYLHMEDCPNLTSLPEAIGNLSSLQTLGIRGCPNLTSLPEAIGNLSSLQTLYIWSCSNLASLPEAIGNLSSLQTLGIRGCPNLTSLPEAIGNLSSLQTLDIWHCYKLISLPEAIGNLSSLQTLKIWSCSNLTSLPEAISNLSSLQILHIRDCPNLTSLPEAIGNLSSLQILEIWSCSNLTSLPEAISNLSSLQVLHIRDCPNLTSLPEAIGNLSSLQSLYIYQCPNLTSLPEAIGNLSSLQSLDIRDCPNLTSLPEVQMTRSLRRLNIEGCPILQQRYSKTSGEDWPKIAHIPDVEIE